MPERASAGNDCPALMMAGQKKGCEAMKKEVARVIVPHKNNPGWYCVKTTFHLTGKVDSDLVRDEETGVPITLELPDKPLDDVYETANAITYYTYHERYEEAFAQIQQSMSIITHPSIFLALKHFLCLKS